MKMARWGIAVAVLLGGGVAQAQQSWQGLQRLEGDEGSRRSFYVQAGVGLSLLDSSADIEVKTYVAPTTTTTYERNGTAYQLTAAAGMAIKNGLHLGGRVVYLTAPDPDWQAQGRSFTPSGRFDGTTDLWGIGADILYYTPSGFFFGGSPMFTMLSDTYYGNTKTGSDTDYGGGIRLQAGKEWSVGEKLWVGANLNFLASWNYHGSTTSQITGTWTTTVWGLGVTGTYR
jgi:hypothetical protein